MEYELGCGLLMWDCKERITDRYGAVYLSDSNSQDIVLEPNAYTNVELVSQLVGECGTLLAQVVELRKSTHIGDLLPKIYPSQPKKGERIILGEGVFFVESLIHIGETTLAVGVRSTDQRTTDWLNPNSLCRVHEQTIILQFLS